MPWTSMRSATRCGRKRPRPERGSRPTLIVEPARDDAQRAKPGRLGHARQRPWLEGVTGRGARSKPSTRDDLRRKPEAGGGSSGSLARTASAASGIAVDADLGDFLVI